MYLWMRGSGAVIIFRNCVEKAYEDYDCVVFVMYVHLTYSLRSVFFVCFFGGILFDYILKAISTHYIHYSRGYSLRSSMRAYV